MAFFAPLLPTAALILHLAIMLAAAPVVAGLMRIIKARLLGRIGPPLLQPWRDLVRLARKQPVMAENASWFFRAAPLAEFATLIAATALVPSFALGMVTAPAADLLVLAGLLALARAILALAAMDVGTAFGGLGASRDMTFAVFAEPAMLLVIFTFALLVGSTNLDVLAVTLHNGGLGIRVSLVLGAITLGMVGLAENGRYPVDNPASHLELTMVHEAMVLEYSGPQLALMVWGNALKLLLWLTLMATAFAPFGIATPADTPLLWPIAALGWFAKVVLLAAGLALFETVIAKMRIFRVPEFLGVAVLLGLLAVVLLLVSTGFA
jgi:formate hydrogenlyase subunit 4